MTKIQWPPLAKTRFVDFRIAVFLCIIPIVLMNCATPHKPTAAISANDRVMVFNTSKTFNTPVIIDQEAVIYPNALLQTTGAGKIRFLKAVTVIGQNQVFDENINLEFAPLTLSSLNPAWFGAKGYDEVDDTKAIAKVFAIAATTANALRIDIPIGKFIITQTIVIESLLSERMSFHLSGMSDSNNGISGSSFCWKGGSNQSAFLLRNISNSVIEHVDFNSTWGQFSKHNLELRPSISFLKFQHCSFGGCAGDQSANINLNEGNNNQVSEITFDNCLFRGVRGNNLSTRYAINGGWANTKDFYLIRCSIGPYAGSAINIKTTDVLVVDGCTFFENDVDISCETCKSTLTSNYSEGSRAFFQSSASSNFNATTLMNNIFNGIPKDGFVIRDGSGTLVLMNNNFGSGNYEPDLNRIRWEENQYSTIYSVGNVYKNAGPKSPVFINRSNLAFNRKFIESKGDLGGLLGNGRVNLEVITRSGND